MDICKGKNSYTLHASRCTPKAESQKAQGKKHKRQKTRTPKNKKQKNFEGQFCTGNGLI
jgi:hypothetical protein